MFDSAKGTGCYGACSPSRRRLDRSRAAPKPCSVCCRDHRQHDGVRNDQYLLNIGKPMIGRYLLFEGEDMTFRELKLRQNKACPLCG